MLHPPGRSRGRSPVSSHRIVPAPSLCQVLRALVSGKFKLCVLDVETHETPDAGHQAMSRTAFGRALDRLLHHAPPDPARLGACRSHLQAVLDEKLSQAEGLVSGGNHAAARKLLLDIDAQYGGLAAPRILKLAEKCGCNLAQRETPGP